MNSSNKVKNVIILDSTFLILPSLFKIDYLNDIYLNLDGKTRFYAFKQDIIDLEMKLERKFRKQYRHGMKYLEKFEKVVPVYFVDEIKEENETVHEFLLRWCRRFKKDYAHVYLATNDAELQKAAKDNNVKIIYTIETKLYID